MNTSFRGTEIAGHTVGASKILGYLLIAISTGLVLMNGYHMSNYLVAKLTNPASSPLFKLILQYIGFVMAAIEIRRVPKSVGCSRRKRFFIYNQQKDTKL